METADEASADRLRDEKEIKVKIPLDYHIKLHTLKVLKGQNISETVEVALGRYFSSLSMDFAEKEYNPIRGMGSFF